MKNGKILICLCILMLILIAAFIMIRGKNKTQQEKSEKGEYTIWEFEASQIDSVTICDGEGNEFHYRKSQDLWTCNEQPEFDLDATMIDEMLQGFTPLYSDQMIPTEMDPADYGLDKHNKYIELSVGNERHTIYIGDYNNVADQYYMQTDDKKEIYTVGYVVAYYITSTPDLFKHVVNENSYVVADE